MMTFALGKLFRFLAAIIITASSSSASAICFVNGAATGANDGSSWKDAYSNPQFALLRTDCKEIWVAKGAYKPTLGSDRTISFDIPSGVAIYGGFSGDEVDRDQRSPATNVTVLSGDIDNNDANVSGNQVDDTITDIVGGNSFHVVYMEPFSTPITASIVVDGFTITGGDANITPNDIGGGLFCRGSRGSECSPTLRNIVFSGNFARHAGGAIYNDGSDNGISSPTLIDVTFKANSAVNAGGGMFNDGTEGVSSPSLTNVFFNENRASLGAAMYNLAARLNHGTAARSNPFITSAMFSHNSAGDGGAIYNDAEEGGAVKPLLYIVTFTNNVAEHGILGGGGVLNFSDGSGSETVPTFIDVTFEQNRADVGGGALCNVSKSGGKTESRLTNVTLSLNSAQFGGAIYNAASGSSTSASLVNVILWGDRGTSDGDKEIFVDSSTVSVDHSVMQRGCPVDSAFSCTNMYTTDPLLGPLSENGGFTRTMVPKWGSSAIDTGLDSSCPGNDQRGQVRPQGAHCEIGAVEVVPVPPPVADPKSIVVLKNSSKEVAFSASDSNPGGTFTYTYAVAAGPTHGLLTVPTDTTIYVPTKDYVGPDSFTYTATDINGTSVPATVSIMVIPPPPPVALPFDVTTPRNTPKSVTLGATDENPGGPFSYTFALVDLPLHGSVALVGNVATYTPSTDYVGLDEFTYTATDVNGTSRPATVTIHVLPVPPPVALPRAIVVPYNTPGTVTFKATDSNAGGPFTYSFAAASSPSHGALGVVEGDKVIYTPAHNYSGPDSFTYTATDVNGISAPATVTITVLPIGAPPVTGSMTAVPALGTLGTLTLAGLLGGLGLRRNRS